MKQKELSRWLKAIDLVAGIIGLLLCGLVAPALGRAFVEEYPQLHGWFWPTLLYIWLMAAVVYVCLWHAWKIFTEIGKDNSFSLINAKRLRSVSRLALLEAGLICIGVVVLMLKNLLHPSILFAMLFLLFLAIALSVVCAALSHLVEKAYLLKQENDLTV